MPRARAPLAVTALLAVALSACQMSVELHATVDAGGGGTFTLRMLLDREVVLGFQRLADVARRERREEVGLEILTDFFACLERRGWAVQREQPDGGLLLAASRSFEDVAAFDGLLQSMRCREDPGAIELPRLFTMDLGRERSLWRSRWFFRGRVDLRPTVAGDAGTRRLIERLFPLAARGFVFQVSAALPGGVAVEKGSGFVEAGTAVWRPALGTTMEFAAESSRLNAGSILLIAVPSILVIVAGVWVLAGRRSPSLEEEDPFAGPPAGDATEGEPPARPD